MRIAYLEDDAAQAELVRHWLDEAGHSCMHQGNGRDFMSLLRRETFDLLVLDWEVPDMSGFAVLEELRASGNKVPVLFATQRDDEPSIVGALSHGADDYMIKPVRRAELLAPSAPPPTCRPTTGRRRPSTAPWPNWTSTPRHTHCGLQQ